MDALFNITSYNPPYDIQLAKVPIEEELACWFWANNVTVCSETIDGETVYYASFNLSIGKIKESIVVSSPFHSTPEHTLERIRTLVKKFKAMKTIIKLFLNVFFLMSCCNIISPRIYKI